MMFNDAKFVEVDLLLRRGSHINRSNLSLYEWMYQNFDDLQDFYNRYGCTLHQHPDGFFFMTLKNGLMRSRLLPKSCVHLGMFIALKARDPEITRSSGWLQINQLMQDIETAIPKETLQAIYAKSRKENVIDEKIAEEIQRAMKILADLNFVEIKGSAIHPLEAIHRFGELARHNNVPDDATKMHLSIEKGMVFQDSAEIDTYGDDNDDR